MMLAVAAVALVATTASPGWPQSFDPQALRTYLTAESPYVLVAAAGEPRDEVRRASDALERALAATNATRVVMNDAALGDLSSVPDAKILELARNMPVQVIAVVRIAAATANRTPIAIVTLYDKAGAVRNTITAEQGVPLAPFRFAAAAEVGATAAPAEELDVAKRRARQDAEDEYEQNYIWFADEATILIESGREVARWTNIYRGKYRVPLEGPAFYELIGRDDLASRYRTRRLVKLTILLGGVATTATGAAIAAYGLTGRCTSKNMQTGECLAHDTKLATSGGIVVGVGLVMMLASTTFGSHPIDGIEARKLADDYNKRLKRSLGLMVDAEEPVERSPSLAFEVGLLDGPGLGTLGFSMRW